MGWREINMNRRKPQMRVAVVAAAPGEDHTVAVRRKAAGLAVGAWCGQCAGADEPRLREFAAGYLLGFARQWALKHRVDLEDTIDDLDAEIRGSAAIVLPGLRFVEREGHAQPHAHPRRARLRATAVAADAGYLVGHLEALCGTQRLMRLAGERLRHGAAQDFLTDCDIAADPMQTREPTLSLRFTAAERAVIVGAFAEMAAIRAK
jgi:hypothetical protein